MKTWDQAVIGKTTSLRDAIKLIDQTGLQIALVVDENMKLEGTLTDGDIRRAILKGLDLLVAVTAVMNSNPIAVNESTDPQEILMLMRDKVLRHMPLVNDEYQVVGLTTFDQLVDKKVKDSPVIMMAGGLGTRLMPLTEYCPKPMLFIGGKPILEHILLNFIEQGFYKFYISVNYMAQSVEDYFEDGSKWGVSINYLYENMKLGTAGALSLLPEDISDQIIVINGDVLTKVQFDSMLSFHEEHSSSATMAVREYDFQVPYGVVELNGYLVAGIQEKPVHSFYVNAGIYILSPDVFRRIPKNTYFDMPTLFQDIVALGKSVSAFPLREYWIDIGRLNELEQAQKEWISN
jgi:dTDP-glucose pyrophosphorylase/CBS domain-containing protein